MEEKEKTLDIGTISTEELKNLIKELVDEVLDEQLDELIDRMEPSVASIRLSKHAKTMLETMKIEHDFLMTKDTHDRKNVEVILNCVPSTLRRLNENGDLVPYVFKHKHIYSTIDILQYLNKLEPRLGIEFPDDTGN